jgi:hypothetical protein
MINPICRVVLKLKATLLNDECGLVWAYAAVSLYTEVSVGILGRLFENGRLYSPTTITHYCTMNCKIDDSV